MNVNPHDETNPTPEPPHVGWLKRLWRRFVKHWEGPTQNKTIYAVLATFATFCAFGFVMTFIQFQIRNDRDNRRDAHQAAVELYAVKVTAWQAARSDYESCKATVSRSDANRAQWDLYAAKWDEFATKSEAGGASQGIIDFFHEWADITRNGPILSTPGKTLAECIEPGPQPQPPK